MGMGTATALKSAAGRSKRNPRMETAWENVMRSVRIKGIGRAINYRHFTTRPRYEKLAGKVLHTFASFA